MVNGIFMDRMNVQVDCINMILISVAAYLIWKELFRKVSVDSSK